MILLESTAEERFKIEKPIELDGFEPPKEDVELTEEQQKILEYWY